ncbi:DUF3667 domain-containing protein [Rhodocytophaga rosea]|uniref:DUF3667 domain-containing protein n=1 Tax=Rhodocytophaga rosea TaxID=2704465 RepID=A0A6C0GUA2_9BACT|nr:DUF3667 domain-containing protein [Rhodocytophaga rosea]QHT71775.1 DUF3667 domain-containing protein [Rhodocytophaga rosea]
MEVTSKKVSRQKNRTVCKNCNTPCKGNYCYHCGQATATRQLEVKPLLWEAFFSVVDVNQGFIFTLKSLCIKPGEAIREYIEGRRIKYYPPHKYVLLIGAVAAFFSTRYHFFSGQPTSGILSIASDSRLAGFWLYADTYTTLINIITIPVFAIFSWLLRRKAYNYAENIVLNTYITSQQLLLFVSMVPLFECYSTTPRYVINFYVVVTLLYNVWVYKQFFGFKRWTGVLCAAFMMFSAYICQFLLNLLFFVVAKNLDVL